MNKKLLVSAIVGALIGSPAIAQESFNVQAAMEQVRKENLQRLGAERQQEIVSILRQRAEDLAAIEKAGYTVTSDGTLQRREGYVPAPSLTSGGASTTAYGPEADAGGDSAAALFEEMMMDQGPGGADGDSDAGASQSSGANERPFSLKGVLSNSAVFEVDDQNRRYAKGDTLPGGYVLTAIRTDSVQVESPFGGKESLYIDWRAGGVEPKDDGEEVFSAMPPVMGGGS